MKRTINVRPLGWYERQTLILELQLRAGEHPWSWVLNIPRTATQTIARLRVILDWRSCLGGQTR